MRFAIIVPARFQSSRFPGKPLTPLKGASGSNKSLIVRCVEAARAVEGAQRIVVATDDKRIAAEAGRAGADVAMTSSSCRNGTERAAEAVTALGLEMDIVVNLQGDAPLTPPDYVEALVAAMTGADRPAVATPVSPFEADALDRVERDLAAGRKGPTAAVAAANGDALYFSKQIIPYRGPRRDLTILHHVGLYAYTPDALRSYVAADPSPLEQIEELEQLRFLETGTPVRIVPVEPKGRSLWEVNNPEDVPFVEAELARRGID